MKGNISMQGNSTIIKAVNHTKISCVHIKPVNQDTTYLDSKFGGEFYLPAGKQVPVFGDCGEMEFLAQINFSQLPPLNGFPQKGILQFFLCTNEEEMENMDTGELSSDGHFRLIYYPELEAEQSAYREQIITDRWPMKKMVGRMEFEQTEEVVTLSIGQDGFEADFGYKDVLESLTLKQLKKAGYDLCDCPDTDRFCLDFGNWGSKVGGHPSIRQGDVRFEYAEYQDYTTLLFQFDLTPEGELEADTFCFFIKPEDLAACQFDDVLLYWHNCY